MQPGFTYKGHMYVPEEDIEPDECRKIMHFVTVSGQEEPLLLSWSPYSTPTIEDFILWVDLGCPGRITGGTLDRQDLERIKCEGLPASRRPW